MTPQSLFASAADAPGLEAAVGSTRLRETLADAPSRLTRVLLWGAVGLIFALALVVRLRLLDIPLERDEGEYAYAGQLILQGIPPYKLACNMKLPGTYVGYAAIMAVFGQSVRAIHLGLLCLNAATTVLLYFLGKRFFGTFTAAVACAAYSLLSVSPAVLGPMAHATHFVVPFALAGLLALPPAGTPRLGRYYASGALLGVAFLMKQPGLVFLLFALVWVAWTELRANPRSWSRSAVKMAVLFFGGVTPFALTCGLLAHAGVFPAFWFWTVDYARQYAGEIPLRVGLAHCVTRVGAIWGQCLPLCCLSVLGVISLLAGCPGVKREGRAFVFGLLLFSFIAVSADFYFRPHYFVLLLPPAVLLIGCAVSCLRGLLAFRGETISTAAAVAVFFVAASGTLWLQRDLFFHDTPVEASRTMYLHEEFPESVAVASYLQAHTRLDDKIAVIGAEPQIYFYAHRHSATGCLYSYPWTEHQPYALTMQRQAIREIVSARPAYLVLAPVDTFGGGDPVLVHRWLPGYVTQNYDLAGVVPTHTGENVGGVWGKAAATYRPPNLFCLLVFQRKAAL